jgi:hypothetical protein
MWWEQGSAPTVARGRWKLTPKGRALVGVVAIIGSVLALKGCAPSSDFFAYDDPAHTQSPSDNTRADLSDTGALSGKEGAVSAQGKIAKEQLVDLSTQASLAPLPAGGSGDGRRIQPTAGVSNAAAVAQEVDTSPVASLSSGPATTQSPDLGSARTVSSTSGLTIGAVGTAQPSTPNLPTKRLGKIDHRVVVGNAETTSPTAAPDTPSESHALVRPGKPEEANAPRSAQATAEPATAQPASPKAGDQPLLRAIGDLFGARVSPAQQPIDPTAKASTGWAVQLAASKSEDESKNVLNRLNDKYASALNGSTIRLHKARVEGKIVYRLRVAGLSKSEAEALCSRMKGDGGSCSVVR